MRKPVVEGEGDGVVPPRKKVQNRAPSAAERSKLPACDSNARAATLPGGLLHLAPLLADCIAAFSDDGHKGAVSYALALYDSSISAGARMIHDGLKSD